APEVAPEQRRSAFSLDGAFGGVEQAVGRLGGDAGPVGAEELGEAMAEIKGDAEPVEPAQVQKLLRQAHDRELIDLAKDDDGAYTVKVRDTVPDVDEALDPPMPDSSAPPSMRPGASPSGGVPARSARFRRGSRGPRVSPPDIPKIGVVEVDPNFKPRIELLPPKQPDIEPRGGDVPPAGFPSGGDERRERGGRGGGGSGGGGGGRGGRGRGGDAGGHGEAGARPR